jgi:hypothetical protein
MEVPLTDVPNLRVSVSVGTAVHNAAEDAPSEYHDYRTIHSVTHGRTGGLQNGEDY